MAKEISSVNGDNPYPGSNDGGMDVGRREREGGGEAGSGRKKGRNGIVGREELPLAGFPQEVL